MLKCLCLGVNISEDLDMKDPFSPALMDSLRCSMVASVYTSWKACCRMVHASSASAYAEARVYLQPQNGFVQGVLALVG